MTVVLVALLPAIFLILAGLVFRDRLSVEAWRGIDRLNYEFLFPALLFSATAARPIALEDATVIGLGAWLILTLGLALGWLLRPFGPARFLDFAGGWQTAWRTNTALAFVAVGAYPEYVSLMSVAVGFGVPLANVYAVAALSRGSGVGGAAILRQVALNPLFLASVAGIAVGLLSVHIPDALMGCLEVAAGAAVPIALMAIGATMRWQAVLRLDVFSGGIAAIKLLILPLVTLGGVLALGLPAAQADVLVIFAALPTATAAHILASVFGADRTLSATMIAQQTLLAGLTLPVWIFLAARF